MDAYSLGQVLREARESKEFEIADVVARLRIRQPILESFEAGDFEIRGVPEIQVRGLLRIYARHLALDEDQILLLYAQMRLAQAKGKRGRRRRRPRTEPLEPAFGASQPLQEFDNADRRATGCRGLLRLFMLLLVSAAAIAVIIFVTVELVGIEAFLPASATPGSAGIQPSETAPPPSDTPSLSSPTPPDGRAQYDGSGILVSILVTQRSWLSIVSDDSGVYEGIAEADTLLEQRAENEILLSGANALALDVIWNGQRQGVIGARGQRVDIRFTTEQAFITLGPGGEATVPPTSDIVAVEIVATIVAEPASAAALAPSPPALPSAIPSDLPTLAPPTATVTPLPTDLPSPTAIPTATEAAQPTAILPPRVTQAGLPPTKAGA